MRDEMLQLVIQHLLEEGYTSTVHTLRAEARMNNWAAEGRRPYRKATGFIIRGEWDEVNRIIAKSSFKQLRSLHYAIYKQQFLERVEGGDGTKAFSILKGKLKPLEAQAPPGEFGVLTYLLSCNSVRDAPGGVFDGWKEDTGRQELASQFKNLLDSDTHSLVSPVVTVAPGRLWTLLKQACAYQVLSQPAVRKGERPAITSLSRDYEPPLCPNAERLVFRNLSSVKCCAWLRGSAAIGCGLADGTVCVWEVPPEASAQSTGCPAEPQCFNPRDAVQLLGHEGRVWSLAALPNSHAVTGGADGTVRVWDVDPTSDAATEGGACRSVLRFHTKDVYSVNRHPDGVHIASGGFDQIVRLCNLEKESEVQLFVGHTRPVTAVRFNHFGNILFSGSKDGTVKLWDVSSGVCLQTVEQVQTKAAVSTLDLSLDGASLLVGYQDSSVRLWDLTAMPAPNLSPIRLQGHVNTSRNLVKATFGPGNLVFGGSEDGTACVWSRGTGKLLSRLVHTSDTVNPEPVYDVRWCPQKTMLATCSDDHTVRIWGCDRRYPYLSAE
eukprot:TRINITY_DN37571_c0_g1_i1.p1 TRINITY_DN37571_c0_g1~~TRINITY_DN37571_c0_g1_i1.p1  ORF type:complete len:584 (+),score=187.23 TRINITY_DN37571_c0_g1_i1:104-1753(+)